MNYVLQRNDVGGWVRYYAPEGKLTRNIGEAYTTRSRREAMRIKPGYAMAKNNLNKVIMIQQQKRIN